MIISHKNKFVFVKTRKTAGTSLEIALAKYCGDDDVLTTTTTEDARKRRALTGRDTQNTSLPLRAYSARQWAKMLVGRGRSEFRPHATALQARSVIGADVWEAYFTFCIERNPWDKAISMYYWRTRDDEQRPPMMEFLESDRAKGLSNFPQYSENGTIIVDHVARFEDLDGEKAFLSERLGIGSLTLPQTKTGTRSDRRHYRDVLSVEERDKVAEICAREIELLGYEY